MAISENAAQKTKTGLLYFAIDRDILIVDPDKIIENKHIAPVY